jgi:hypothetical protein
MDPASLRPGEVTGGDPHGRGRRYLLLVLFWLVLLLILILGRKLGLERKVVVVAALLWSLVTPIFGALVAYLTSALLLVPFLGPLLVKLITLPIFLLVNGAAFLLSFLGLRGGRASRVLQARIVAAIFTAGVLLGYLLGKAF